MKKQERLAEYPETDSFKAVDVITLPHTYMISKKCIGWVATNFDSKASRQAVKAFEQAFGPSCQVEGCNKTIEEHVVALVIEIDSDEPALDMIPGLDDFCKECLPLMVEDKIDGFAWKQKEKEEDVLH